uniref:Uncharacterized protein n=1 Tax=Pyrodinium bahamense TaxID=73915 RepID=A0A7S0AEQ8_9DINO|mmetsp:Transcript_32718/g.90331  ORF Transcript_32718/g.90331 Transcript_32718/m.90331 type:complete len:430 (+) Transcript_32718:26-1315(+)
MAPLQLGLAKVLAALASAALAGLGCSVARRLERSQGRSAVQDWLLLGGNTFAAGILLAASLTHMLPDATEALQGVTDFPLAPGIAGVAFCFLVILGEAVEGCMPKREEPHTETACATYGASFALWPRWELMPPHGCEEEVAVDTESGDGGSCCGVTHSHKSEPAVKCQECLPTHAEKSVPALSDLEPPRLPGKERGHSCHSHSRCCKVHRHADAPCSTQDLAAGRPLHEAYAEPLLLDSAGSQCHAPGHDCGLSHQRPSTQSCNAVVARCHVRAVGEGPITEAKAFLLFFALCFHSVMEGLGMGSAQGGGLLLPVVLAILAHKGLAAFALGCSLTQSDLPAWKYWTFVSVFASGTPIGCFIGMLSTRVGTAATQGTVSGVCIALSSGTFLQVSSMEMLPRALAEERHTLLASCGLAAGFLAMSALAVWC